MNCGSLPTLLILTLAFIYEANAGGLKLESPNGRMDRELVATNLVRSLVATNSSSKYLESDAILAAITMALMHRRYLIQSFKLS